MRQSRQSSADVGANGMKFIVFFMCIFFHIKGAVGFQLQCEYFAPRLAEIKGYERAGVGTVKRGVVIMFFQFIFQKITEFARTALLKQIPQTKFNIFAVIHDGTNFGRH